jgi:hypothetical protein
VRGVAKRSRAVGTTAHAAPIKFKARARLGRLHHRARHSASRPLVSGVAGAILRTGSSNAFGIGIFSNPAGVPACSFRLWTELGERELSTFEVELYWDGELVQCGGGSLVLGSPLRALRHLVELLVNDPHNPPLCAGEVVSTAR